MKRLYSFLLVLFLSVGFLCASAFSVGYGFFYAGDENQKITKKENFDTYWLSFDFSAENTVISASGSLGIYYEEGQLEGVIIPLTVGVGIPMTEDFYFTVGLGIYGSSEIIDRGVGYYSYSMREYAVYLVRGGICGSIFANFEIGPLFLKAGCIGGNCTSANRQLSYEGSSSDIKTTISPDGFYFVQPQIAIGLDF